MRYSFLITIFLGFNAVMGYQTVDDQPAKQFDKVSQLSAIYASVPNLVSSSSEIQERFLPATRFNSDKCLPLPKYSQKHFQLSQQSGYNNSIKILFRDSGIPPSQTTQWPILKAVTTSSGRKILSIQDFPEQNWQSSSFEYGTRVYTLSSIAIKSTSDFYVMPENNKPLFFPIQVDFLLNSGNQKTLTISMLYHISSTPSQLLASVIRKIQSQPDTPLKEGLPFGQTELNLNQFQNLELDNLRDGFYTLSDMSLNGYSEPVGQCDMLWIVSNKELTITQYQYDQLMKYLSKYDPETAGIMKSSQRQNFIVSPLATVFLALLTTIWMV